MKTYKKKFYALVDEMADIEHEAYFCESDCPAASNPMSLAIYSTKAEAKASKGEHDNVKIVECTVVYKYEIDARNLKF